MAVTRPAATLGLRRQRRRQEGKGKLQQAKGEAKYTVKKVVDRT